MDLDKEKLLYLLKYYYNYINSYVYDVINDSTEDPHFSAVYSCNLIKCYIEILSQLGEYLPYTDVKSYLLFYAFSDKEYQTFEESRKKESEYYIGEQF